MSSKPFIQSFAVNICVFQAKGCQIKIVQIFLLIDLYPHGPAGPFASLTHQTETMAGCCAPHCSNSSRNGIKLYQFPRGAKNKARNEKWHQMAKRAQWTPTPTSKLCEVLMGYVTTEES